MYRLVTGEYRPPLYALMGLRVLEVDHGRAVVALAADEWLSYRGHEIAPGGLATLTYQALIIASLTLSPIGGRLGVVNLSARFLGPVVPDGRELVADAETLSDHDGDSVVASVTVTDADGKRVATAYQTSVLLPLRARPPARAEPVLVTVVFTDLVGSTALAGQLGDEQWRHLLAEQEAVVRRQLEAQRGREIKTTGDGFLATFDSPARAVRCARAIREGTRRLGIDVRAGVHTGECEFAGGDITGIAVHLAARVLDMAAPGEVLVSSTVRDLLLGSGLCFEDRGRHVLKGIEGEWQLFALEE